MTDDVCLESYISGGCEEHKEYWTGSLSHSKTMMAEELEFEM